MDTRKKLLIAGDVAVITVALVLLGLTFFLPKDTPVILDTCIGVGYLICIWIEGYLQKRIGGKPARILWLLTIAAALLIVVVYCVKMSRG